ncbi:kremen protein 1-like [Anneissia japonica]|uniref:kremen protein 1-like n=1 Tax=Anneissia japonica TaxID=1529436 RepID=UPI001425B1CD|nr:kremen protein 1-like [Anneissia japonica]
MWANKMYFLMEMWFLLALVGHSAGTYKGCFKDNSTRAMSLAFKSNESLTINSCIAYCYGHMFAGLQCAEQCFCGDHTYSRYGAVADTECNANCTGNSREKCGGTWRNSVYTTTDLGVDDRHKLNMLGFTPTPAVNDTEKTNIRGYTLGNDQTTNIILSIILLVNLDHLSGEPLCNNSNLNFNVTCKFEKKMNAQSTFRIAEISSYNGEARFGVFTAYAQKGNRSANATIIVHHENGKSILSVFLSLLVYLEP